MNADDLRRIAMSMPEAEEKAHFGKADFRVCNRIFATLPDAATGVVKLTADEQAVMMDAEPGIFSPAAGAWGRQGWTRVDLAATDEPTLTSALAAAWRNVAPAKLLKASGADD